MASITQPWVMSSRDRNNPFEFHLGQRQAIAGRDEGVQGKKIGGKRTLTIPSNLGYGPSGADPTQCPLVFAVELLALR